MAILTTTDQGLNFTGGSSFIKTGTSTLMSFNTSGEVGVGTDNPSRTLHVLGGDGGSGTHIAHFEGRSGVVGMYVRGDGRVGIGTTSPASTFNVVGHSKFNGTSYHSHFNYETDEHTYIRGGKAGAQVYINDTHNSNVGIAAGGGRVGIGTNSPDASTLLHVQGVIGTTNGTAAAPTHTFYGDPDNGMFRAAANTLAFSTDGNERLRIDSSGNVTINSGNLFLANSSSRISNGASGEIGFNYNTSATGSLVWYGGGTSSKFSVTNAGQVNTTNTIYARKDNVTNYTDAQVRLDSFGGSSSLSGLGFHISGSIGRMLFMNSSGDLFWNSTSSKIWHAGNDGSGSGLDADKLDGQQPSQSGGANRIAQYASNGYLNVGNWIHSANSTGIYWPSGLHLYENSGNLHINTSGANYTSVTQGTLWGSSNDGSGSGLDADLLDGNHASAFATSSQGTSAENALPRAGGTMTGDLYVGGEVIATKLLSRNRRITSNQVYPIGHYTPGETLFEIDPTWTETELQDYFNSSGATWASEANAPGGYSILLSGSVNVGTDYNSGFPWIPIDQDGIYYMECWIKNVGNNQTHYMGSMDKEADLTSPASGTGNPGSYGYFVMSNTNPGNSWVKRSAYISGHSNTATGSFETDSTYFTPMALFNYGAGSGTRACHISGWKIIRVDHVGNRTFHGNIAGNSSNTTEIGTYSTGAIKRIRMCQGGELHFGDTTTSAPLGITEGNWDSFADNDRMSIYGRNSIKFYAGSLNANLAATLQSTGLTLNTISNATSDLDKFLVSDSGEIKYRTGSQVLSDIGAYAASNPNGYTNDQTPAEILTAIKTVDGSGSGLDADLLDGVHLNQLDHAEGFKTYSGISASSTQARRHHIGRLYGCPAHWDGNWQNIELHVTSESYESANLRFAIMGDYVGANNQANMLKLYLKEAHGPLVKNFRFVLGTPVDAGWDHSGQNTYYVDLYAEAKSYAQYKINIKTYGHPIYSSNPTSGGAYTVFYNTPTVTNISTFTDEAYSSTKHLHHTIWNSGNVGTGSGLDADLLDGSHASDFVTIASSETISGAKTFTSGLNISASASNTQLKLKRTGSATGEFNIYTNTNNLYINNVASNTFPLTILNSGNVGIGTISPQQLLHVNGEAQFGATSYQGDMNSGKADLSVDCGGTSQISWVGNYFQVGGTDLNYNMRATAGLIDTWSQDLTIRAGNTGTTSLLRLGTNGQTSTIVCNNGSVGIGTTSPAAKLHAYNSAGGDATDKAGMLSEAVMKLQPHASNSTNMLFAQVNSGSGMGIQVTNGPATANWDIALSPFGGNVGIGTTSPAQKLDVGAGHIRLDAGYSLQWDNSHERIEQSDGHLEFFVNNTESMTLDTNGIGIGTTNPNRLLQINGGHGTTRMRLFYPGSQNDRNAYIDMWASEPGVTYNGSGIGSNINGSPYYGRYVTELGQSYIRFVTGQLQLWTGPASSGTESTALQRLTILDGGNVGIGTTSPATKLHVVGRARFDDTQINAKGVYADYFSSGQSLTLNSGASASILFKIGNTTALTLDSSENATFAGYTSTPNSYAQNFYVTSSGTNITNRIDNDGTQLYITYSGTSNRALEIKNSNGDATFTGNVGIGTTAPAYNLTIADALTSTPKTLLHFDANNITNGGGYNIDFRTSSNDTADRYVARIRGIREGNGATSQLSFWTENSGLFQRMTIKADGNVGIGTTSPAYKLDVAGEGKVTSKFRVGGAVMLAEPGTGVLLFGSEGGAQTAIYSAGVERIRINASGNVGIGTTSPSTTLDVNGITTSDAFRTDTSNTDYNVISRNSTSTTLWVQAAQSGSLQGIASFRYGSSTVNAGTEVCAIRRNSSYFINTKLGIGTNNPGKTLDVTGEVRVNQGDLEIAAGSGEGLILKAPSGGRYRVTVNNSGELQTAAI